MLTYEVGKRMLRNTLQAVEWISDKEYQKRVVADRVGGSRYDSRPLTPPYVRNRIRRFMITVT
jgi:hypothetical protein